MLALMRRCTPFFLIFFTLAFLEAGLVTEECDARARSGGRSFGSPQQSSPQRQSPGVNQQQRQQQQPGGFGRSLLGGLAGTAIGAMLFGGLFGMGGAGTGFLLPLIILGIIGFLAYRFFIKRPRTSMGRSAYSSPDGGFQRDNASNFGSGAGGGSFGASPPPIPPIRDEEDYSVEGGLAQIRRTDPGFDEKYFMDVASDVFFQVQAGWMRRDVTPFAHLLSDQLAAEYEREFAEMRRQGVISKLENIAVRKAEIVATGTEDGKDFISVRFTANLLDYKMDEKTNEIIEGSNTQPVKFVEDWTWARPIRTEEWRLEGIQIIEE